MIQAVLLCGPSLAGKSTVAAQIARVLDAEVINADAINAERNLPFGAEGLPESTWAETLRIQIERAHAQLARHRAIVVDDTLCYRWLRDRWREELSKAGTKAHLLLLGPPVEELRLRHARLLHSGERPVLSLQRLEEHAASFEWPDPDEHAIRVDTQVQLEAWMASALA